MTTLVGVAASYCDPCRGQMRCCNSTRWCRFAQPPARFSNLRKGLRPLPGSKLHSLIERDAISNGRSQNPLLALRADFVLKKTA